MSEFLKVSGKKFALPQSIKTGSAAQEWKYSVRPGGWIIAESPRGERRRFALWEGRGKIGLSAEGCLHFGEIVQERKGHGAAPGGGDSDLTAQFPGKVRKVLVSAGTQVEAGMPLILVEAMKMEFTVKAPFAGTVTRVLVAEGQQLAPGDRFVELVGNQVESEAPDGG